MKKLQNNFTTPEQSKRLLELGVPKDSADCYYVIKNNYTAILHNELFTKCRDEMIKVSKTSYRVEMHDDDILPCWSAGRLIEIWNICVNLMPGMDLEFSPSSNSYIEDLVRDFEFAEEDSLINFSELEKFQN